MPKHLLSVATCLMVVKIGLAFGIKRNQMLLKAFSIPRVTFGSGWAIHPLTGNLFRFNEEKLKYFESKNIPSIVTKALQHCDQPYTLSPSSSLQKKQIDRKKLGEIDKYLNNLIKIGNTNFMMSRIYASFKKRLFLNTTESMQTLSYLDKDKLEYRCLQRCLCAAKTSSSFENSGVIFVGALLPLREMHAWIIEDGQQPDNEDRDWINFTPLLALCFNDQ